MIEPGSAKFDVVDKVYCAIDDKKHRLGDQALTAGERVVDAVWSSLGVLENGSFQYFFESGLNIESAGIAFEALGLKTAAECFRLAGSLVPLSGSFDTALPQIREKEDALDTLANRIIEDKGIVESKLFEMIMKSPALKELLN